MSDSDKMKHIIRLVLLILAVLAIAGCQTINDKRKIDYQHTKTPPPLDVPPDLVAPGPQELPGSDSAGGATYSEFVGGQKTQLPGAVPVLPQYPGIRIARDGGRRWLIVERDAEALWDPVREFVLANGLVIDAENPKTGTIETDWAENRAKVGTGGQRLLAKWFKSWYSTGMRDKFRLRLERGAKPGTTEIYLSHQGMEEVLVSRADDSGPTGSVWQPRPTDPEVEIEMLHWLVVHLGGDVPTVAASTAPEPAAAKEQQATLDANGSGAPLLTLNDSIDRAWRRVGLSLDRIGFTVEDRDRSKGVYYVRYIDPDRPEQSVGWLKRLFGVKPPASHDQYQVRLGSAPEGTQVEVLDPNGAPETSKTGERILSLLYEQLK